MTGTCSVKIRDGFGLIYQEIGDKNDDNPMSMQKVSSLMLFCGSQCKVFDLRSSIKKNGIFTGVLTDRNIIIFKTMEKINFLVTKYQEYCDKKGETKSMQILS